LGSGNLAAGMEMPGYAAADLKGVQTATVRSGRSAAQAVISDFKKKLDSLSMAQPAMTAQAADMPAEDLSMVNGTPAQELPQGVVGILEGFGLLDYQTDPCAVSGETAQPAATEAQASDTAPDAQQAQVSGQFARMLIDEQPGGAPADMPRQPEAGAEKYSGSLESTNNQMAASAAMPAEETAVAQLRAKMTPSIEPVPAQPTGPARQETASTQLRQEAAPPVQATDAQATADGQAQTAADGQAGTMTAAEPRPVTAGGPAQTAPEEKAQDQPAADKAMPATAAAAGMEPAARGPQASAASGTDKAQTAEAQQTTSSFVKDNVIRIVDKVSASAQEGRYEFDVDLKPDFLGKVSIRLTMQDGEIRMHVKTDDPAVKGMFSDQTNSLTTALKEKGIVISTVDVSYQDPTATGRDTFGQPGGGGGQRREGQPGWTQDRYAGGDVFDAAAPAAELRSGSSVEYLA
jgi:flagellar hook-length control protein FliK